MRTVRIGADSSLLTPELQRSPHVVLTVVRFLNRSKKKLKNNDAKATDTLTPMVITSDCIACSISEQKEGMNSSLSAVLKGGDINYLTAIHSGDYVIVNFVDGPEQANDIKRRALNGQPINQYQGKSESGFKSDGFKGLFKIQSVRRQSSISDGQKSVSYKLVGYSHYFLSNKIYFIPQLVYPGERENRNLFLQTLSKSVQSYFASKAPSNIQDVIEILLDAFLGTEFNANAVEWRSPTSTYFVPDILPKLLGVSGKRAIDMTNVVLGPHEWNSSSGNQPPHVVMNPSVKRKGNTRIWKNYNGKQLYGRDYSTPLQMSMIGVGEMIQSFINDVVNEMYVCHKLDPESGMVLPTIVIREKPFTSTNGPGRTKFKDLPAWDIGSEMILTEDIGVEEAARINFVQVYGRTQAANIGANFDQQVAFKNWSVDNDDIHAHGLRPYVTSSNFDFPEMASSGVKGITQTPLWSKMVADWLFGAHLKLNGTAVLHGVFEPIAPGDNCLVEGVTYHIESVSHQFQLSPDGDRSFRTQLTISHGIDYSQDLDESLSYAEMSDQEPNKKSKINRNKNRSSEIDPRTTPTMNSEEYSVSRTSGEIDSSVVRQKPVETPDYLGKKKGK